MNEVATEMLSRRLVAFPCRSNSVGLDRRPVQALLLSLLLFHNHSPDLDSDNVPQFEKP
jgi:hypothetical protein